MVLESFGVVKCVTICVASGDTSSDIRKSVAR
jgi:hypothetical protein